MNLGISKKLKVRGHVNSKKAQGNGPFGVVNPFSHAEKKKKNHNKIISIIIQINQEWEQTYWYHLKILAKSYKLCGEAKN